MRRVSINLYHFDELCEVVRNRAIKNVYNTYDNVCHFRSIGSMSVFDVVEKFIRANKFEFTWDGHEYTDC